MKNLTRIKELREQANLSQKELAKNLNISLKTLKAWEENKQIMRLKNIVKVCNYFNVKINYFLYID